MDGPPPAKKARLSTNENDVNQNPNENGNGYKIGTREMIPILEGKPPLYFSWLDDETLAKIFSPLKLYDLLQMYEVHEAYQKVIAEGVMKNRPLNISEISENYDVRDALKFLGAFTPEVIIKQTDIQYKKDEYSRTEEIVRLIGKRCSKEHLKKLTIVFDSNDKDANAFRTEIPESVLGIESLTIDGATKCDEFFEAFKGQHLQSITLRYVDSPEKCLKDLNYGGLRVLSLENCDLRSKEFWTEFFKNGIASLESLTWNNVIAHRFPIDPVDMATGFPALKRLHLDYRNLQVSKFPNLQRLALDQINIFDWDNEQMALALQQSVHSIEELSITMLNKRGKHLVRPRTLKTIWSKTMGLASNLRKFKLDYGKLEADQILPLIDQIPYLERMHLIGSKNIDQEQIKSFFKKAKLQDLIIEAPIVFSLPLFRILLEYRSQWFHDSPAINIFLRREICTSFWLQVDLKGEREDVEEEYVTRHIKIGSISL